MVRSLFASSELDCPSRGLRAQNMYDGRLCSFYGKPKWFTRSQPLSLLDEHGEGVHWQAALSLEVKMIMGSGTNNRWPLRHPRRPRLCAEQHQSARYAELNHVQSGKYVARFRDNPPIPVLCLQSRNGVCCHYFGGHGTNDGNRSIREK